MATNLSFNLGDKDKKFRQLAASLPVKASKSALAMAILRRCADMTPQEIATLLNGATQSTATTNPSMTPAHL